MTAGYFLKRLTFVERQVLCLTVSITDYLTMMSVSQNILKGIVHTGMHVCILDTYLRLAIRLNTSFLCPVPLPCHDYSDLSVSDYYYLFVVHTIAVN